MSQLSYEAYERFRIYLGQGKADEVADEVASGIRSEEDAETWSLEIEEFHNQSRGRRDIDPSEWNDFEDGWRPSDW